jgi:hypothetical protein
LAFVAMLNCSECQLSNDVAHFLFVIRV